MSEELVGEVVGSLDDRVVVLEQQVAQLQSLVERLVRYNRFDYTRAEQERINEGLGPFQVILPR